MSDESTKSPNAVPGDGNGRTEGRHVAEAAGASSPASGFGATSAPRPVGKRQVSQATTARANAGNGGTATAGAATATTTSGGSSVARAPEVVKTRRNPFTAIIDYFRGVFSEIAKVIWPTGKEMVNYTLIVLAFLIFMIALISGVDWLATAGVQRILS